MDLGSFMRLNGISEQSLRPEFRVLSHLGDVARLQKYLEGNKHRLAGYRRIVVVEDFVGTGHQMEDAVPILEELVNVPVLICPIIAANEGCMKGEAIQVKSDNRITFSPHFRIPIAATLGPEATQQDEPDVFSAARVLVTDTWQRLKRPLSYDKAFGIGNLGLLVLTYLNCPNNVPPLIHRMTDASDSNRRWIPLFPRAVRES